MNYYDTFMNLTISPAQKWRDDMQEAINQRFDNASTYWEDVGEEQEFGSLHFKNINVRITTIVDTLTGQRNNDDYRKIIYPDYFLRATATFALAAIFCAVRPYSSRRTGTLPLLPNLSSTPTRTTGTGQAEASDSHTAPPRPPMILCSSAVTTAPVLAAERARSSSSIGFIV